MAKNQGKVLAALALALACVFWGLSFPLMQIAQHALGRVGAFAPTVAGETALSLTLAGWRFALMTVLYWLLTGCPRLERAGMRAGFYVGLFFTAGSCLQIVGLRYVLPSLSGILTTLLVVFTPMAQAWLFRQRVGAMTWCAAIVALIGIGILSQPNEAAISAHSLITAPPFPWFGELLTIACALMFTGHVLSVDHFGGKVDARQLTLAMVATMAVVSCGLGLVLGGTGIYAPSALTALWSDRSWLTSMSLLVVFGSVIAFHLMNTFQPRISPSAASVIYCLEPVFATVWSVAIGTESLTAITVLGGAVVLFAVLLVVRFGAQPVQ